MKKIFVFVCMLAILAIICVSPIAKVVGYGAHAQLNNSSLLKTAIYEKSLPMTEPVVLLASQPTATEKNEKGISEETILNLDQEILNSSNEMEFLSEQAFKQNKIVLSKQITQTYYDLLEKNTTYHNGNPSFQKLETLIQEYDNQLNLFKAQLVPVVRTTSTLIQSLVNNQTQPLVLDIPHKLQNYTLWEFTPQVSGIYQFSLELKDKNADFDIDFSIWNDVYGGTIGVQTYERGKELITIRLTKGISYYIETVLNNDVESTITVTYPFLELNKPVDVSLSTNQFALLKFTPTQSASYKIFTGSFGGFGDLHGAKIELYSDEFLTHLISEGGEAYQGSIYAELNQYLEAGKTYYIKLSPDLHYDNNLHVRVQVVSSDDSTLLLNVPTDIEKTNTDTWILEFLPPTTGDYRIATDYFEGGHTDGGPPYSVLSVYDERMEKILGWGYGGINLHLEGKTYYYIKIKDYSSNIKLRVTANMPTTYVYDLRGRLDYIQLYNGKKLDYTYDLNGNLKSKIVITP